MNFSSSYAVPFFVLFFLSSCATLQVSKDVQSGRTALKLGQPKEAITHLAFFITDGPTGGDCSSVGTWDSLLKTCTLNQDLTNSVEIDSSGLTFDCSGHKITGPGFSNGVLIAASLNGVTVTNCQVLDFETGIIAADSGDSHTINRNTIYNMGRDGIRISSSGDSHTISRNIIYNIGRDGIRISSSGDSHTISQNTVHDIVRNGIIIIRSGDSHIITRNTVYDIELDDGINVFRSGDSHIITWNIVRDVGGRGIEIFLGGNSSVITDNTIVNPRR